MNEIIKVGETILPSGKPIQALSLLSRPAEPAAFKLLVANDGETIYARQYPHLDQVQPDEWQQVGPCAGSNPAAYALFGFVKGDLVEFVKDA